MKVSCGKARKAEHVQMQPRQLENKGVTLESLPIGVNVVEFAEARALEMQAMAQAVSGQGGRKRIFQTLPRYMRRRAMSHNIKRLPKRLRSAAEKEMTETSKAPSRRSRRRPKCIRKVFESRHEDRKWLETHLWHAKRMKMVTAFGFRLAGTSTSKGARRTHVTLKERSLIHDMSYYGCIELAGKRDDIKFGLEKMTDKPIGLDVLEGRCEGSYLIHHQTGEDLIGPCKMIWKSGCLANESQVWLWFHPACFCDALKGLQFSFLGTNVSVTSLEREFNRFRLLGLNCDRTLRKVVKFSDESDVLKNVWRSHVIPRKLVIGVNALDPRTAPLDLPDISSKSVLLQDVAKLLQPEIWNAKIRSKAQREKESKHHIDTQKAQGMKINPQSIPILVIQQPSPCSDLTSGFDIVIPSGWGMPFWMAFIYGGATVASLSTMEQVSVESGMLMFPHDFPDVEAGQEFARQMQGKEEASYFKRPPAKRVNFAVLGIQTPFHANWEKIADCDDVSDGGSESKRPKRARSWCVVRRPSVERYPPRAFLYVWFEMVSGVASWLSIISLPTEEDVGRWSGQFQLTGPCETVSRSKANSVFISALSSDQKVKVYDGKLSRVTMGYVTSASYRFGRGCGAGVGLCLASMVTVCLKREKPFILIKNRDTLQYRLATFKLFQY